MYQPAHFQETRRDVLAAFVRAHPLGLLVTAGPSGLEANPVPFLLDDEGPHGRLRCHVARANPQWRDIGEGLDALVVFQGPERYVTPAWYAEKRASGKVVPTWNYAVVQARGRARAIDDAAWLARQIDDLTRIHEEGRAEPWSVDDAPAGFIPALARGIVGIEIEIATFEGKWKVSQNRPEADRRGVLEGLAAEGAAGEAMGSLVRRYGGLD